MIQQSGSTPLNIDQYIKDRKQRSVARAGDKLSKLSEENETFSEKPISIEAKREQTRAWLAGGLLGLLALSLLGIAAYIFSDILVTGRNDERQSDLHRELMTIVWTSQVTLVSGALGYYFGSERNKNNSED